MKPIISSLILVLNIIIKASSECSNFEPCLFEGMGGEPLREPREVASENGTLALTLNVSVARITIEWLTMHRRVFNGEIPGPTWRIKPGDVVNVTLVNSLTKPHKIESFNEPRYPNSTNLHVHGLHISSEAPQDDVFKHLEPLEEHTYNYTIIDDHPSGTYWYHPHLHGSTMLQVTGGMAGMIIIEDPVDGEFAPPQHLLNVSCPKNCNHEVQLLFQPTLQYISQFGRGYADNQRQIQDNPLFRHLNNISIAKNGTITNITLEEWLEDPENKVNYFTTNGQLFPKLDLEAGQMKRFRMVNAGGSMSLELTVVEANSTTQACSFKEIAMDGIYLNQARVPKSNKTFLVPSAKADWLIVCNTPGLYELRSITSNTDRMSIGNFQRYSGLLLTLNVTGSQSNTVIETSLPKRQYFVSDFQSLSQSEVAGRFAVEIGAGNLLNRKKFESETDYRFKSELGTVQEWYILNSDPALAHPIHIHVNHFQIISYNNYTGPISTFNTTLQAATYYSQDGKHCYHQADNFTIDQSSFPENSLEFLGHSQRWEESGSGTLGYVQAGDFRDVILVPPLSNITIRFKTDRFIGNVVMHCHILTHEDQGMMMTSKIVPPGSALSANTLTPAGYPGQCSRCDAFPFNADTSSCDAASTTASVPESSPASDSPTSTFTSISVSSANVTMTSSNGSLMTRNTTSVATEFTSDFTTSSSAAKFSLRSVWWQLLHLVVFFMLAK